MISADCDLRRLLVETETPRVCGGMRLKGIVAEGSADRPLVTVITAVYNGQPYVAGCLDSVLSQDYPNIEHIVMDGGSSDGTLEVLRQYDDRIALWRSEPDNGLYDAWNKALLEAHGEWICFLGADDQFLPGAVSAYMALAASNPHAEYLSSKIKIVHATGYVRILGRPWTWRKFAKAMCTPQVGTMHRRSLFQRLGTYDTSYRIVADYELLLRARDTLRNEHMPVITVMMRAGGVSCASTALDEASRAKIATGGRNKVLSHVELYVEKGISLIRPPVRFVLVRIRAILGNVNSHPSKTGSS
jgi:glycosyltransferase involved in cell wall biosynthesis